jgi:hypothetical protein
MCGSKALTIGSCERKFLAREKKISKRDTNCEIKRTEETIYSDFIILTNIKIQNQE